MTEEYIERKNYRSKLEVKIVGEINKFEVGGQTRWVLEFEKATAKKSKPKYSREATGLIIKVIDKLMSENGECWCGTCEEISREIKQREDSMQDFTAVKIGKLLAFGKVRLESKQIDHAVKRENNGQRVHYFSRKNS